ncbi:DNA repair protein XRCC2-like [Microplitis mediator]|uniref:DNA repair protein XRCC2-like n=1 Tax=Microplitis mediator TaxID=375433 RepID=UPI002557B1DD|nr:DNA repair protein XRCC2-like [Microplitis mediator]XP_057325849.1 DNA repair protein XRCC2-like [Microplitis mediator]
MARRLKIESGLQFYGRIQPRPTLQNLDNILFPNGLSNNDTIEINASSASGNSLLLTRLIAQCILPFNHNDKEIGGIDARVLLINTNHNFLVSKLVNMMMNILNEKEVLDSSQVIDDIIKRSLTNLTIINCYSSFHYLLTLKTLDIVISSKKISLVTIDTIDAYYWEDRKSGGQRTMSSYIKNLLMSVQKHTFHWNNVFIYTRLNFYKNKSKDSVTCVREPTESRINYRLKLEYCSKKNKHMCSIESHEKTWLIESPINSN